MKDSALRVLLLSPLPPPVGGIATWTALVCKEAAGRADLSVQILNTALRWRKITDTRIPVRAVSGTWAGLGLLARLIARIVAWRPHVVHLCTSCHLAFLRDCLLLAVCRVLRVPAVLHLHFGHFPELAARRNWEWRLACCAIALADRAVALDLPSRDVLQARFPGRVVAIPNMVDVGEVDLALGQGRGDDATPCITLVGHVVRRKGVWELVEACRRLRREQAPELRLCVVGPCDDAARRELLALAGLPESGGWLELTGPVDYAAALQHIARATIFCLPAYAEGFPYVIMESMAAGKPVVASAVGAIPQALDAGGDEECGICVQPGDVAGLTRALGELLGDTERAAEFGRRAAVRCRRDYSPRGVFGRLAELWHDVSGRAAVPGA